MRDVLIIPFNSEESIVIASDNSGAIGLKESDEVKVPYEMVSYYSFRVAVMECLAAGGAPFAVTLQNFCGDETWGALTAGVEKGLGELDLTEVPITGSTESNFPLSQSAIGMSVLGKKKNHSPMSMLTYSEELCVAIIGTPLVGNELIERESEVVPLSLFKEICGIEDVTILPVGSKGILCELNGLFENRRFSNFHTSLDLHKSSGPSTCFIAVYPYEKRDEVKSIAGHYYHELKEKRN